MSTRTLISAKMVGKVFTIYCHHDGYPAHIAPLLLEVYNTQEKIEALIMLGDMSSIGETLDTCDTYTKRGEPYKENAPAIHNEWKQTEDVEFLYEYYWDGEKWHFIYFTDKELKPLTAWKEEK